MANSIKLEKEEFLRQKAAENKFLTTCLDKYEELMEEPWDTSTSANELETWHQKRKLEVINKLAEDWVAQIGPRQMPASIATKVTEKIDQSFVHLSRHFQQTKLKEQNKDNEKAGQELALKLYNEEMDKYMKNNPGATLKDVIIAHTKSSMTALKTAKEVHKVSAETIRDLKRDIEDSFQDNKTIAKMTEKADKDPAIGIDLGTTMCCVMVYHKGKVEVVPNSHSGNSRTTPSYVAYLEDGTDTFGMEAKEAAYLNPETTIYDAKRMLGRPWKDEDLQNDRNHWPFDIVQERNHPKIKTWQVTRYPHEISAKLLAQLRYMADEYLGLPSGSVTKAVITVPAYFTEPQRRATSEAAEIAGLEVLSILSEPTAAAIAYSWERRDKTQSRKALIYDLGGGTFDVSLAVVESNNVDVLAVDGDTHLGGQDFDQLMMNLCIEEFKTKERINLLEGKDSEEKVVRDGVRSAISRLKLQCEKAKEKLSGTVKTTIAVDGISGDKDLSVVVTREKFESLITPMIHKSLTIVDRAIDAAGMKGFTGKEEIDDVILVGGSTRLPLVAKLLSNHFNGKQLCKYINPDEAVAYGAAVQAAILNESAGVRQIKVQDVTPMTLGIHTYPDFFSRIIHRNSQIPCEKTKEFRTQVDNQPAILFTVLQGESNKASENKRLGEFLLEGLPLRPAEEEKANVTMRIDGNGLLHVKAVSLSKGNEKGITITSDCLAIHADTKTKIKDEIKRSAQRHATLH